jgi:hypothetical protein
LVIEVKQADSWTVNELVHALENQLAEDYLKTTTRRHGILYMSNHGRKGWKHTESGAEIKFADLVEFLSQKATDKTNNSSGPIQLAVMGLDVSY